MPLGAFSMPTPTLSRSNTDDYRLKTLEESGLSDRLFLPRSLALREPPLDSVDLNLKQPNKPGFPGYVSGFTSRDEETKFATLLSGKVKNERIEEKAKKTGAWQFVKDCFVPDPINDFKLLRDGLSGRAGLTGAALALLVGAGYVSGFKGVKKYFSKHFRRDLSENVAQNLGKDEARAASAKGSKVSKSSESSGAKAKFNPGKNAQSKSPVLLYRAHRAQLKRELKAEINRLKGDGYTAGSPEMAKALDKVAERFPWPSGAAATTLTEPKTVHQIIHTGKVRARGPLATLHFAKDAFNQLCPGPNSRAIVTFYSPRTGKYYDYNILRLGEGEKRAYFGHFPSDLGGDSPIYKKWPDDIILFKILQVA